MRISDDTDTATRQLLEEIMALRAAVKDLAEDLEIMLHNAESPLMSKTYLERVKDKENAQSTLARHKDLIDGL